MAVEVLWRQNNTGSPTVSFFRIDVSLWYFCIRAVGAQFFDQSMYDALFSISIVFVSIGMIPTII